MALCTPLLRGPFTEWSDSVVVEGCLPGATAVVTAVGPSVRTVAKGNVGGGSDRLPLLAGEKLKSTDVLLVFQTLGAESSIETPHHLGSPVAPAPTQHGALAPLAFRSHVYPCGRAIWVCGAVPGAQVTIKTPLGVIAAGRANEGGDARLTLSAGASIPLNAKVTTWQEAPAGFPALAGTPSETTFLADKLPAPFGAKLPIPELTAPAKGCDRSVHLGGIIDGADVTITRTSDGTHETAVFDLNRLRFDVSKPLSSSGDKLEIVQELKGCHRWERSDPLVVHVEPAKKPATPTLLPPCDDSIDVYASNLESSAIVTLTFAAQSYRAMVPEGASSFVFRITKMNAGATITIVQEKCGLQSDTASTQPIATGGGVYYPPDVEEPLYACARAVRVRARPGTWLQIFGDVGVGPAPISPQVFSTGSERIDVAPYLVKDQKVWVAALRCGATRWKRNPNIHVVQAVPEHAMAPIIVDQLIEGARSAVVEGVAGALVQIYSFKPGPTMVELIGENVIDPIQKRVFLWRTLTTKELVYAVQIICGQISPPSAMQVPLVGVRSFDLGVPLKRMSTQSSRMKPLVCLWANFVCRHDGVWNYTAELENEETEADVSFDLQFTMQGVTPPFGKALPGQLSASGNGPVTKAGLRAIGVPPKKVFSAAGHFAGFEDPAYWFQVYAATGKFTLEPAWKNYAPTPEAPDEDPDKDKKGTKK
jgi:hypothetical protein